MNRDDARNLLVALNQIQQFVPPIFFNALASNPILLAAQEAANALPDNVAKMVRNPEGGDTGGAGS